MVKGTSTGGGSGGSFNAAPVDFLEVLRGPNFGADEVRRLSGGATGAAASEFRRAVEQIAGESGSNPTLAGRVGVGQYLLGQHRRAVDTLSHSKDGIAR